MFWIFAFAGAVLVIWLQMKSAQGKSAALDALRDREVGDRASRILAEVRREEVEKAQDQ